MKDRDRLVKEKLVKIVVVPVVHMIVAKIVMKKVDRMFKTNDEKDTSKKKNKKSK